MVESFSVASSGGQSVGDLGAQEPARVVCGLGQVWPTEGPGGGRWPLPGVVAGQSCSPVGEGGGLEPAGLLGKARTLSQHFG